MSLRLYCHKKEGRGPTPAWENRNSLSILTKYGERGSGINRKNRAPGGAGRAGNVIWAGESFKTHGDPLLSDGAKLTLQEGPLPHPQRKKRNRKFLR